MSMCLYPYMVNLGMSEGLTSEEQTEWLRGQFRELDAKRYRLQPIVDKLPKCWRLVKGKLVQDAIVLPGMTLWDRQIGGIKQIEVVALQDLASSWPATIRMQASDYDRRVSTYCWHVQGCFLTREAAEAAARKEGD